MLGSLRARLYVAFGIVILITLLAAGLAFFYPLGGYRDQLAASTLRQVALPMYYNLTLFAPEDITARDLLAYLQEAAFLGSGPNPELESQSKIDALLVNRRGQVVRDLAGRSGLEGEQFDLGPESVAASSSEPIEGVHRAKGGREFFYVAVPLPPRFTQGTLGTSFLVLVLPKESAQSVIGDLTPRLLLAGAVGLGAALLAVLVLSGSVYRPLQRVARAAVAVAKGDYREKVPVEGPQEARALAENFNLMTEAVQRSQQTLRDFLANVSHELKTPLTSIRGFSQALRDGTVRGREEEERAARVIEDESRRLLHLVQELLDLSRMQSGQVPMRRAPVQVQELFSHCADVFALRSRETGVKLEVGEAKVPPILADFDRLEQVLGNLLDNAFRHTPAGGTVQMGARGTADRLVEISVADSGQGIPADELGHVFDRFYRGNAAGRGSGLGLAISREIVRAHNGQIWAESSPGAGTRLVFTVPVAGQGAAPRSSAPDRKKGRASRAPGP